MENSLLDPIYFGVIDCIEDSEDLMEIKHRLRENEIEFAILSSSHKIGDGDDYHSPEEVRLTIVPIHQKMDVELLREIIENKRYSIWSKLEKGTIKESSIIPEGTREEDLPF